MSFDLNAALSAQRGIFLAEPIKKNRQINNSNIKNKVVLLKEARKALELKTKTYEKFSDIITALQSDLFPDAYTQKKCLSDAMKKTYTFPEGLQGISLAANVMVFRAHLKRRELNQHEYEEISLGLSEVAKTSKGKDIEAIQFLSTQTPLLMKISKAYMLSILAKSPAQNNSATTDLSKEDVQESAFKEFWEQHNTTPVQSSEGFLSWAFSYFSWSKSS